MAVHLSRRAHRDRQPAGHPGRPARPYQPDQRHGDAVAADPAARRPDLRDGGDDDAAQPRRVAGPASIAARTPSSMAPASRTRSSTSSRSPPADYRALGGAACAARPHPLDAAAYAELFKQSSPPQPIFFSSVPQGLFQRILAQSAGGQAMTERHLAGGAGPLRLARAAVRSRLGKSRPPTRSSAPAPPRSSSSAQSFVVAADHAARQVALSVARMAHQPRSQEDRHHVRRAGLRDAQRAR